MKPANGKSLAPKWESLPRFAVKLTYISVNLKPRRPVNNMQKNILAVVLEGLIARCSIRYFISSYQSAISVGYRINALCHGSPEFLVERERQDGLSSW